MGEFADYCFDESMNPYWDYEQEPEDGDWMPYVGSFRKDSYECFQDNTKENAELKAIADRLKPSFWYPGMRTKV